VPSRALVPPLSFHPTPAAYSTHGFAGLLHPAADHWVRRVSIPAGPAQALSATVAELSSTARALRSFSLACSYGGMSPCSLPSHRWVGPQFHRPPRGYRLSWTSLDLKALLHRRSRCERSTVASRVLPAASLGFSFCCVSGPTRRSWELRASAVANHNEGFSFTRGASPWANSHRRRWC